MLEQVLNLGKAALKDDVKALKKAVFRVRLHRKKLNKMLKNGNPRIESIDQRKYARGFAGRAINAVQNSYALEVV
jgi:hypothetical protein